MTLAADSRNVSLRVQDNGIGIPEEDIAHIFDRSYRVDKARSRATGGTGLGLSIAAWIAARHGGRIDVQSKLGLGSKFTLVIPLTPPEPEGEEDEP